MTCKNATTHYAGCECHEANWQAQLTAARKECEEQARLLGMSAERELKLRAKLEAYKRAKAENDERFQLELGEARAELKQAKQINEADNRALKAAETRYEESHSRYKYVAQQLDAKDAELAEHRAKPLGAKINELIIERGDLREKLAAKDAEIARLKEKLEFWELFDKENRDSWDHVGKRLDAQSALLERATEALWSAFNSGGALLESELEELRQVAAAIRAAREPAPDKGTP